tara:strand:+ start:496 stop:681 length:186 start_codon:yes stop_codon:yes gene_type:complete
MITLDQIREGSVVIVRDCFGQGSPKRVTVTDVLEDIKRGEPGIEYGSNWAYLNQVDRVVVY